MAFDQSTRGRLQKLVNSCRGLLSDEFSIQLQQTYGLDPKTGEVTPMARLTHLDDRQRHTAEVLRQTLAQMEDEPPVLVDWMSWHHTFGGSHNLGIVLYNAGSFYIDDGRPTPDRFHETIRNLKEISPTMYLNVPVAWAALANALTEDAQLRETFFKRVKLLFFAGAALSQDLWQKLSDISYAHCGERIRIMAGLGMLMILVGVWSLWLRWRGRPHHGLYREYSRRVNAIYEQYTDLVEPFGIDESWLDVTGSCGLFGSGAAIARQISDKVKRCSSTSSWNSANTSSSSFLSVLSNSSLSI